MKHDFQLYTLEEAKAKGLPCEQQKGRLCKHCGKQLVRVGSIAKDGFVRWLFTKNCDCGGRREEVKRQEEEEERLREEKAKQAALAKCRKADRQALPRGQPPRCRRASNTPTPSSI